MSVHLQISSACYVVILSTHGKVPVMNYCLIRVIVNESAHGVFDRCTFYVSYNCGHKIGN